jgi:phage/plasmid-like protein (TIGR03299 family)
MSAAIDMSNRRANMAYVGDVPWHGLGQILTPDADIETWRREAGLDWQLTPTPSTYQIDGKSYTFPGRKVLYRNDTKTPLSIVGEDYKIVQPGEVLEFYRDLVAAAGYKLETAGSLQGGRRYWALAKLNREMALHGQDRLLAYLLLATSCDGSLATTGMLTSVRVVCQNTLHMAVDDDGQAPRVKIPHSRNFNPQHVKEQLGVVETAWQQFDGLIQRLANRKVSMGEAQKWLLTTFGDPDKPLEEQENPRILKAVMESVKSSPGSNLRSSNGTAWGLVNGATYYFDHARNTRTADNRLNSAWFSEGARYKQKALQNALKLAA